MRGDVGLQLPSIRYVPTSDASGSGSARGPTPPHISASEGYRLSAADVTGGRFADR
ncbi:hypothetical protein GCM10023196_035230 [Actinoallomurus vinaceus]|uniref:Uncharacterized protein n=1 Tax=Actinoallomurus vinaceus TaxID=1080074 RepID=A0ABP8UAR4_9ACTN